MEWERIRAHYARLFEARAAAGTTQETIAHAGGLRQNQISRILHNRRRGPGVVMFLKAVIGLGLQPSEFFADLERHDAQLESTSPRLFDFPRTPAAALDPTRFAAAQAAFWRVLAEPKSSPRKRSRKAAKSR